MPETNIGAAEASDLTGTVTDYSVDTATTDGETGTETEYLNSEWSQQLGYYKEIPELRAAIDAVATWTVGKGYVADIRTEAILGLVTGWGTDTFNTLLENAIRTYYISGDFYAEIIRDEEGDIMNLKPLDPSSMKIIADGKGIIKRYEQVSKVKAPTKRFKTFQIFHLARNRVADEIHGVSVITALEKIILMRNEAMADMKILMHRHVKPMRIWHLDTDDTSKISEFKTTTDEATENAENIYIPKGTVEHELITVPANATLNPLPWISELNNYFFEAVGVPQIIVGGIGGVTEAAVKIAYLAFQQRIEEEQLFIEEQVFEQIGYRINLEFPASLENELLSDKAKDQGSMGFQANETTAGAGQ